jgi:hypothetical protein
MVSTGVTGRAPLFSAEMQSDIIWGAAAIAGELGCSRSKAYYLLEKGLIKSARKVGDQWQATRSGLRREFGVE